MGAYKCENNECGNVFKSNNPLSCPKCDTLEFSSTHIKLNKKYLVFGFLILLLGAGLIFIKMYNNFNSDSKIAPTSTPREISIVDKVELRDFEWTVDSTYKFGGASAQFQKEFSKQKKSKGKLSNELNTHIQSNAMFTFNDSTLNYQNAKARYLDKDISLEGGVFTITYSNAIDKVDAINSPVKKKIATPKKTIVDKECKDLQNKLKKVGYYNGKIDGTCGEVTFKAVKDFEEDQKQDKLIEQQVKNGWLKRKPKFDNIYPVKHNGVIFDEIKIILTEQLLMDKFKFKLASKPEVVLFRSLINIDFLNYEINEINNKIEKNDNILQVSFNRTEVALSYPLIVEGVILGYFNYKETKNKILRIGDTHSGGIVFRINVDGSGLVAGLQDLVLMNWYSAMSEAANSNSVGYDDWYLPSQEELELMYNTIGPLSSLGNIGGFKHAFYWSSSENYNSSGWYVDFNDGDTGSSSKSNRNSVRAIRAF